MTAGVYANSSYNAASSGAATVLLASSAPSYTGIATWQESHSSQQTLSGGMVQTALTTYSWQDTNGSGLATSALATVVSAAVPGAALVLAAPNGTTVPVAGAEQGGGAVLVPSVVDLSQVGNTGALLLVQGQSAAQASGGGVQLAEQWGPQDGGGVRAAGAGGQGGNGNPGGDLGAGGKAAPAVFREGTDVHIASGFFRKGVDDPSVQLAAAQQGAAAEEKGGQEKPNLTREQRTALAFQSGLEVGKANPKGSFKEVDALIRSKKDLEDYEYQAFLRGWFTGKLAADPKAMEAKEAKAKELEAKIQEKVDARERSRWNPLRWMGATHSGMTHEEALLRGELTRVRNPWTDKDGNYLEGGNYAEFGFSGRNLEGGRLASPGLLDDPLVILATAGVSLKVRGIAGLATKEGLKRVGVAAGVAGGVDLADQGLRIAEGKQKSIDKGELAAAMLAGGAFPVLGAGAPGLGGVMRLIVAGSAVEAFADGAPLTGTFRATLAFFGPALAKKLSEVGRPPREAIPPEVKSGGKPEVKPPAGGKVSEAAPAAQEAQANADFARKMAENKARAEAARQAAKEAAQDPLQGMSKEDLGKLAEDLRKQMSGNANQMTGTRDTPVTPKPRPSVEPGPGRRIAPHKDFRGTLPEGYEANHLNQTAAYGRKIRYKDGLCAPIQGDAFVPGTQHYKFHQSLGKFWRQFQPNGARAGQTPTNAEYGQALERALREAGYTEQEVAEMAAQAARERAAYGLKETDPVPDLAQK
jgi:uncharacterized protein YjbJ (UPF0337 family)